MTPSVKRLKPESSVLIVIDVQDKLLVKIPTAAALVRNAAFLLDVAKLLDVPVRATEQYPKGLGPTTAELARRLPQSLPSKTAFSCCGAGTFLEELEMLGRPNVVLAGWRRTSASRRPRSTCSTPGCTSSSRWMRSRPATAVDHDTALRRLEQAGAVPTTAEAVAFEWVGDATHPQFKAVSQLVISRSQETGVRSQA